MNLESRWPKDSAYKGTKITAKLVGKLPESVHARADMLDAEALRVAAKDQLNVVACGDAKASSIDVEGAKVPALSRDYFCEKATS